MFTGIVEEIGTVVSMQLVDNMKLWDGSMGKGHVLVVRCSTVLLDSYLGCSIAVNGTCLTLTSSTSDTATFGVSIETLRRTNLKSLVPNDLVNLERSLRADGRNSGHFVQGHVDGTASIKSFTTEGDSIWVTLDVPQELLWYIVPKGFIAIDGTSLTVCDVNVSTSSMSVMLVEYTQKKITLPLKKTGDDVNIEVDVMAKYVEKSMVRLEPRLRRLETAGLIMTTVLVLLGCLFKRR